MSGFSDYFSKAGLNWLIGQTFPTPPTLFLALFTTPPTDANTGATEVTGGSYARVQIGGTVAATASFTTASPNITMTSNPGWVVPGMNVYDTTNAQQIGTVSSYSGTALVLTANAAHASSGTTDSLYFSAFGAASGSAPSQIITGAAITYAAATASWGNVNSFGIFDALTVGNLIDWDYLGNFPWLPSYVTAASPGVIDAKGHGFSNGNSFVFSNEYGGTAPTFSAGNYTGVLTVAGVSGDTFNVTGVNTSATGSGMVRGVTVQTVSSGVTVSFAAGQLTLTSA